MGVVLYGCQLNYHSLKGRRFNQLTNKKGSAIVTLKRKCFDNKSSFDVCVNLSFEGEGHEEDRVVHDGGSLGFFDRLHAVGRNRAEDAHLLAYRDRQGENHSRGGGEALRGEASGCQSGNRGTPE